jgi:hypothetical protein
MKTYDDPMISRTELLELCKVDQLPRISAKGNTGEVSGRPADLIKSTNYKSKVPAKMPNAAETKVLLERARNRKIEIMERVYQEKIDQLNGIDP